ncbi:MBL fold metallo-hydrolase [Pseudothermotoga sp.]|nr:MBL fold metallo-hydrolase [Pseudothermotoga sp.]MCX7812534.1 MBL fold metallo-hydrolase [Pseudothermotoga sp.]MDW8138815.1 MBL fold metallo-hydrolase [Pseudothermotoga sp.]
MIKALNDRVIVVGAEGSANITGVLTKAGVVIVDTSLFPEKARKVKLLLDDFFKKPIELVVNTHYHPDHTFGNAAFEGLKIVSSEMTKSLMEAFDEQYLSKLPPVEKIITPSFVFDEEFEDRDLLIKRLGGHTLDSSIVFFKQEKVLISGDLIFNGFHAEIVPDSDLNEWIEALKFIEKLKPIWIVPGHGEVSGLECLISMERYLMKVKRLLEGALNLHDVMMDENFSKRKFPELFGWSLENLLHQRGG